MQVFRITTEKWAGVLQSSGRAARWNSNGIFITYSASSRALACLEMLVHLNGEALSNPFKITIIDIPEGISMEQVPKFYNDDWVAFENYHYTQAIGDEWSKSGRTAILKVPSAIIKNDFNYLINPFHADFAQLEVAEIEEFQFDLRLKADT